MAADGKQLEALVAFVEKTLTPHGLTISTNERVFNDEGVQIAEFDVDVCGKFGSTAIRWLIECRDRPGGGPAPGSWIEQLVGRRDRFGFNKVTAVSTTGFAPGAVDYARRQGIELREVASLNPEAFLPWISLRTVEQRSRTANLQQASIVVDASEPDDKKRAFEFLLANTPPDALILRSTKTSDSGPLANAFLSAVEGVGNLFEDVIANGPVKRIDLNVNYTSDEDHFAIDTAAGPVRVRSIAYVGELQIKSTIVPVLEITEYRRFDAESPISQIVSFAPQEILGVTSSLELHRIADTGEFYLRLRKPAESV